MYNNKVDLYSAFSQTEKVAVQKENTAGLKSKQLVVSPVSMATHNSMSSAIYRLVNNK